MLQYYAYKVRCNTVMASLRKLCVLDARALWCTRKTGFPAPSCVVWHLKHFSEQVAVGPFKRTTGQRWRHLSSTARPPEPPESPAEAAARGLRILKERSNALEQGGQVLL